MSTGLEEIRKRTNKWLLAEGFSMFQLSVGIDVGLVILGKREALGTTVTSASAFARFGSIEDGKIVMSKEVITFLNLRWSEPIDYVDVTVLGATKHRKVAFFPIRAPE